MAGESRATVGPAARTKALVRWLAWLGDQDCTCSHAWRSHGRLHGVSMGMGWSRMTTEPECPHHGIVAEAVREARNG
jgi:hypothetical protein